MKMNFNKIVFTSILILGLTSIPAQAKERICGSLSTYVYIQNANPPQVGCLYAYNPYDRMTPFTLRVQQVINGGILVSADTNYYGSYFSNPKTIFIQTSKQFVDDQLMRDKEIVKYMGVYDYITVLGARKRVYKFYRYGKYEIEKNVDTSSLEDYGFIEPKITYHEYTNNNKKPAKPISTTEVDEYFKSLKSAEKEFVDTADINPSKRNDLKFRKFLFTYWNTIEDINENVNDGIKQLSFEDANGTDAYDSWTQRAKDLTKHYKNNGVDVIFNEDHFVAAVKTDYLTSFYKYLTLEYRKWLNFEGKRQTEVGIQDNCHSKLYEIVKEGKDYYDN